MLKTFFFLIKLSLFSAIAVWFLLNPGTVKVDWLGVVHEVHVGIAVLGVILLSILGMIVLHIFLTIRNFPQIWRNFYAKKQEKKGYQNFTEGLAALAMDDLDTAREKILKTQILLGESPLPLILTALSSQKSNDYAGATRVYGILLKNKSTEFLGYYGLTQTSKSQKDYQAAYLYAKKAFELAPSSKWVLMTLFHLSLRLQDYEESFYFLKKIKKYKVLDLQKLNHWEAVFLFLKALKEPDIKSKIKNLQRSLDIDPSFIPAVLEFKNFGKPYKIERALISSLKINPHIEVAKAYVNLYGGVSSAEKIKRSEDVLNFSNAHYVGHLILTKTALDEGFSGIARTHLDLAILSNQGLTPTLRSLSLKIQDIEGSLFSRASKGPIDSTFNLKPDKIWECQYCFMPHDHWDFICKGCDQLDTILWKEPHFQHTPPLEDITLISLGDPY
jgi:HemY protein